MKMINLGGWNAVTYCQMFMEGERLIDRLTMSDEAHFDLTGYGNWRKKILSTSTSDVYTL